MESTQGKKLKDYILSLGTQNIIPYKKVPWYWDYFLECSWFILQNHPNRANRKQADNKGFRENMLVFSPLSGVYL